MLDTCYQNDSNKNKQVSLDARRQNRKDHFGPDLGLLGPNLGHKTFLEVSAIVDVKHCPKLQAFAISRKTSDVNLRKW